MNECSFSLSLFIDDSGLMEHDGMMPFCYFGLIHQLNLKMGERWVI